MKIWKIAVIEKNNGQKESLVFSQCFKTSPKLDFHERLYQIGQAIEEAIKKYSPDTLAIETLFFTNNQKTALNVAEVRGVIIYEGKRHKLEISEHTPNQIKTSVTGYGKSDKAAISKILPLLIKIPP
jgi:crossover junction endodeoxyribonuclease RuvC